MTDLAPPPWSIVSGQPTEPLRQHVDRYDGYVERADDVLIRRESAGAFAVLILGWGAPLDVTDPRAPGRGVTGVNSFVAGTFDSYAVTRTVGVGQGVELILDPLVAGRLFGVPMRDLANRAVTLGDLSVPWLTDVPDRLASADGWQQRFALLDAVLSARLAATAPPDPRVAWAWRRLVTAHGRVAVGALAAELGWSRRHFAATFRRSVGMPPKTAARLLRFQRTVDLLSRPGRVDGWAGIAATAGYFDQAHLIREVREFTGGTPTEVWPSGPA
ncbi:helix-turn-helix domain-containing protein [Plantactinospora sp. GCM10030261]|uniref:helix-turn-helix domain-containing protein n=1 Tax=Plantactinospora sp. GCM10030261 TaxID=3273420 RepID=UPI00360ABC07